MVVRAPRLVAVDLDGTLLRSDLTVSRRTRAALELARTAGATVVIVTARSPRSVVELARVAGIDGRAICANGATIFDLGSATIVAHTPLPMATGHRIVRAVRAEVPDIVFGWELELRFGSEPAYEARREAAWWPRPDDSFPPCDVLAWDRPFTKLLARAEGAEQEAAFAAAREAAGDEASVTLTGQAFVEVMGPGVTKAAALARLAGELGVDRAEVVAFGDHVTDVGMLEWAGLGVAVANAHPAARVVADETTATNDEDGVAATLERLFSSPGSPAGRP